MSHDHTPPKIRFPHFLEKFPEVEMPVTLGENTHLEFSKVNDPLPDLMVEQFIMAWEDTLRDEFTEYIACFQIAKVKEFHAVVYWRAGLMDYRYILMTYTKQGEYIDHKVIAGTYSDGEKVTLSVATIEEDWTINVASGQNEGEDADYDAEGSTVFSMELMPDGTIEHVI
ncbi:MAG: hypothetical protein R2879_01610 [Saprospiraceae bacterium]